MNLRAAFHVSLDPGPNFFSSDPIKKYFEERRDIAVEIEVRTGVDQEFSTRFGRADHLQKAVGAEGFRKMFHQIPGIGPVEYAVLERQMYRVRHHQTGIQISGFQPLPG